MGGDGIMRLGSSTGALWGDPTGGGPRGGVGRRVAGTRMRSPATERAGEKTGAPLAAPTRAALVVAPAGASRRRGVEGAGADAGEDSARRGVEGESTSSSTASPTLGDRWDRGTAPNMRPVRPGVACRGSGRTGPSRTRPRRPSPPPATASCSSGAGDDGKGGAKVFATRGEKGLNERAAETLGERGGGLEPAKGFLVMRAANGAPPVLLRADKGPAGDTTGGPCSLHSLPSASPAAGS